MNLQARFHPTVVQNLLRIKNHFPSATIAGGAVRDLVHGREIKDIDVFVEGSPNDSITLNKMRNKQHWIHQMEPFWKTVLYDTDWLSAIKSKKYGKKDPLIDTVVNLYNPTYSYSGKTPSIDIVFLLTNVDDYIKRGFDFNLCKATFDGTKFSYTTSFMSDSKNKTITLCGPNNRHSILYSLREHLPRLKSKYPTFTSLIPDEYRKTIKNISI